MLDIFTRKFMPDKVIMLEVQEQEKQGEEQAEENIEGAIEDPNAGPFESKTKYAEWMNDLEQKFTTASVKVLKVAIPRDEDAALHSICREIDPFVSDPELASAEDLPPAEEEPEEEEGEESAPKPEKIEPEVYGRTKNYCPVTLKHKGVLVKGNEEFGAKFRNKIYLLNGEEERVEFVAKPMYYTTRISLKPSRIWILGHPQSGRSSIAQLLNETYNMPILKLDNAYLKAVYEQPHLVRVQQFVHDMDNPPPKEKKPKTGDDEEEEEEPEPEEKDEETVHKEAMERLVKIFVELMKEEPYLSHGYVMDAYPQEDIQSQLLLEANQIPDLVLHLTVDEATYEKRFLPKKLASARRDRLKRKLEKRQKEMDKKLAQKRKKRPKDDEEPEEEEEEEQEELPTDEEIKEQLTEGYNTTNEIILSLTENYNEKRIATKQIDANKPLRIVKNSALSATHTLLKSRDSLFNYKSPCSHKTGIQLIRSGRKLLNRFGFCDPVDMYVQGRDFYYVNPQNMETITFGDDTESLIASKRMKIEEQRLHDEEEEKKRQIEEEKARKKREREERRANRNEDDPEEEEPEEEDEVQPEEEEEGEEDEEKKKKPKGPQLPEVSYPVIFDHKVYFFKTEANRNDFLHHPMPYIKQEIPSKNLFLRPKIAILSGPETEETKATSIMRGKLSETVAKKMDIINVGLYEIIQRCLLSESSTASSRKVKQILETNYKDQETIDRVLLAPIEEREDLSKLFPDTFLLPLLKHRLETFDCWVHGFTLDNFYKLNHVQFVERDGNVLDKVFLIGEAKNDALASVQRYFEAEHVASANWLSPKIPNWNKQVMITKILNDSLHRRHIYLTHVEQDLPAPIYDTGIVTPAQFKSKLSPFQQYSVVSYVDNNVLVDTSDDKDHKYYLEYKGKIYCCHSEDSGKRFAQDADHFANERYKLPEKLPTFAHDMFNIPTDSAKEEDEDDKSAQQFEFKGFDPVLLKTMKDGQPIALWGKNRYSVRYAGKLYRLASEDTREQFMQQPWMYVDAKLPIKLPVRKKDYPSLGIVEYLDEVTAKIVTKSLVELNKARPLYPFLSSKESALKFLSLFIRANHEGYTEERRKRCQRDYEEFLSGSALQNYFAQVKERVNDPIVYDNNAKRFDMIKQGAVPVPGSDMY
jgi:YHS domain-containing protein/adenylate kinase family enzyme